MPGGGKRFDSAGADEGPDRRAASEVIGIVLLFGIVLAGVVVIMMSGSSAVETVQEQNDYQAAKTSMEELKTNLMSVTQDSSKSQVRFKLGGAKTDRMRIVQDGTIRFTVNNNVSCFTSSRELGAVKYESDNGATIGYQANGVWEKDGDDVEIISRPDASYRETRNENGWLVRTLTFPLTNVNASDSQIQSPELVAEPSRETRDMQLLQCQMGGRTVSADWVHNVTIEISENSYYTGWARYLQSEFSEYLDSNPNALKVYDNNQTVLLEDVPLGLVNDPDDDGIPNSSDNCDTTPNRNQLDYDGDGQGNACDTGGGGGGGGTTGPSRRNTPPSAVAQAGSYTTRANGTNVSLDASSSFDPDGPLSSYDWTLSGPGRIVNANSPSATYVPPNSVPGVTAVNISLTVEGNENVAESTEVVLTLGPQATGGGPGTLFNTPPSAVAQADDYVVGDNSTESLNATGSFDPGGSIVDYQWTKVSGPGTIANANSANAEYQAPQNLPGVRNVTVRLNVTDNSSASSTTTLVLTANPGADQNDSDGDGIADENDDCPGTGGTGVNGCSGLSVDGNALRVNQSGGEITYVDSMIAKKNKSIAERPPIDVTFVLDRSGSMAYSDANGGWQGSGSGSITVPNNEMWLVLDYDDDASNTYIDTGYGDAKWVRPGESFDGGDWEYYRRYDPGSDPSNKRVEATKDFIGALKQGTDRAGFVEFYTDAKKVQSLSYNLNAVNSSIRGRAWGGTDITSGIEAATDQLTPINNSRDQYIVLLSDGKNTDSDTDDAETRQAAQEAANKGITVYTVALGDGADEQLLEDVADITGGKDFKIDNAGQIQDVFEQIAGDVVENKVKRIEHRVVEGNVSIGNSRTINIGSYVHDPTSPGTTYRNLSFQPGSLLSLSATAYTCSGTTDTGADWNGSYNVTQCNTGNPLWSVDNSTSTHKIFVDGDSVPGPSSPLNQVNPWERDFSAVVNSYDPSAIQGGQFNLSPNEAFFALQMPNSSNDDYVVLHFKANNTDPGSGPCTSCSAYNTPPTAIADADDYVVTSGNNESLTAAASFDPDGSVSDIQWSVVTASHNGTLVDANTATPEYELPASHSGRERVKLRVTVTDNASATATDTVVLTAGSSGPGSITPFNTPPTAVPNVDGNWTIAGTGDVSLNASLSGDPDGSISSYQWTKLSGPGNIVNPTSPTANYELTSNVSSVQEVKLKLTVTDDDGATATGTIVVTVGPPPGSGSVGGPGGDNGWVIGIGGGDVEIGDDD